MARSEKQIVIGFLALVGILFLAVLFRGLDFAKPAPPQNDTRTAWKDPADTGAGADGREAASVPLSMVEREGAGTAAPERSAELSVPAEPPEPPSAAAQPTAGEENDGTAAAELGRPLDLSLDYDDELVPYTVRDDDSLSEIALRELGSVRYLDEIYKLNEGLDAQRLMPGQVVWLPGRRHLAKLKAQRETPAAAPEASSWTGRTHTVEAGDNLWKVAVRHYGKATPELVGKIVTANQGQLSSADAILRIGTVLRIPE